MDIELIKKLREKTGAGLLDCQKALEEAKGNLEKAEEILRKKGEKIAASKSGRTTNAGLIGFYLHSNERIAALVELNCETDFVAKNQEFRELAHDLAMQVAATDPLYLKPEDIPKEILEKERKIYQEELAEKNLPPHLLEKAIEGKLEKFYQQTCLLKQPFIKDEKIKIEDLIKSKIAKLKENIQIKRFVRYEI